MIQRIALRDTRFPVHTRAELTAAAFLLSVVGATSIGCSRDSNVEAYPGVISPLDVAGAESSLEGPELARLAPREGVAHLVGRYGCDAVVALVLEKFPADKNRLLTQRLQAGATRFERR
jgi:hypothetical protein